jgi:hypothetical protein
MSIPPPIDCSRHESDSLYETYLYLYHRLKLLERVLARYVAYTSKDWYVTKKSEVSTRISVFVNRVREKLKDAEKTKHNRCQKSHDVHDIRKRIKCLLDTVNMQLGTLTHVMHRSYLY